MSYIFQDEQFLNNLDLRNSELSMYNKNTKNCIYFSNVNKSLNKILINYKFNFKNVVKMFINH